MSTIDWPEALIPQTAQLTLRKAGTQFASPFNGTLQSLDFVAERWVLSASLAQMAARNPRGVDAFCNRLAGGVERVRVWPFHQGVPRGTLRGSPTLSAAAARGNATLAIANVAHAVNLLSFPEDMRNSAEAGATRPWTQFIDSDSGVSLQSTTLPDGSTGNASRLAVTGAAGAVQRQIQQPITVPDNTALVASVFAKADQVWALGVIGASKTPAFPSAIYRVDTGAFVSAASDGGQSLLGHGIQAVANGWYRVWWSWNTQTGGSAVAPIMQLKSTAGADYPGGAGNGLLLWGAQVEYGTTPTPYTGHPTLLAGDFIGAGGQLFMVAADARLVNGAGTVAVVNRARGAIASGSPVAWNRPTVEMVMPAMQAGPVRRPGAIDSAALDLVEVW